MRKRRESKSILQVILLPLIIILVIQFFLFFIMLFSSGVLERLNQNARDIFSKQVENRRNYLLGEMVDVWSNLDTISGIVDQEMQERLDDGRISLKDLDGSNAQVADFIKAIQPDLIRTMYEKRVSGVFVVLNTKDLDAEDAPDKIQAIYMRDRDPLSVPSTLYGDIQIKRAPVEVVRSGIVSADRDWKPMLSVHEHRDCTFYHPVFQEAYLDEEKLHEEDYGRWTPQMYTLEGDVNRSVAYSVPLILEDGTVYGVIGVELLESYFQNLLPVRELNEEQEAFYFLAVRKEGTNDLYPVLSSGAKVKLEDVEQMGFLLNPDDETEAEDSNNKYYAAAMSMKLYTNNAPFDSDKWYLLGGCSKDVLYDFAKDIRSILIYSCILTILVGMIGSILVSIRLSRPILKLSKEVEKKRKNHKLFLLPSIGINEIDQLAHAVTDLSREVIDASTRFLSIMDMASIELAGYEVREDAGSVFVTANYFPLLGMYDAEPENMTLEEFDRRQGELEDRLDYSLDESGKRIYRVPKTDGTSRYLRSELKRVASRRIGLVEDVTDSVLEKMKIERERDCDALTSLYGRNGFRREADKLFQFPKRLKQAALLMMDLDHLKQTNDTYGHSVGDSYIQTAGRCFVMNTPKETLCARISGDEFLLLFYGYDSQDEIREKVAALYEAIKQEKFVLPNGENMGINASGGVAWYPQDAEDLSDLMKYADFAMYQVKKSKKGEIREFEHDSYQQKLLHDQSKADLRYVLENWEVKYHLQPIFDGKTGKPYAYEALMRVNYGALKSPLSVLNLAKETHSMEEVECMTVFCAVSRYQELLDQEAISENAYLFINSISNACMKEEYERMFKECFSHLRDKIIVEITEDENLDVKLLEHKKSTDCFSGLFALDDYGSGYNTELNLLEIAPKYVKIDTSIIRGVDKDKDKQHIISNIVNYAHQRDMLIIAEGLETEEELRKTLELGADLFQGYLLARPAELPSEISAEAAQVIRDFWTGKS